MLFANWSWSSIGQLAILSHFIRALIVEVADLYWRFATIRRVL